MYKYIKINKELYPSLMLVVIKSKPVDNLTLMQNLLGLKSILGSRDEVKDVNRIM